MTKMTYIHLFHIQTLKNTHRDTETHTHTRKTVKMKRKKVDPAICG